MDYSRPDLADRLAADYVAGTLRGAARRRFEALLPAHPLLRDAVRDWQGRLMPLTLGIAPQTPPPHVWQRIESRINGAVLQAPVALPWWGRLSFWRGLSALASVAALSLLLLLANPDPAQPPLVVVLSSAAPATATEGPVTAAFVASISGDGRAVVTKPLRGVSLEPNRVLELWALPASGAPRSLGLISASGASVVQKNKVQPGTAALAVSLEPTGGSTTGAPTGPVLFVGKLGS